jgi:hypothetical protein
MLMAHLDYGSKSMKALRDVVSRSLIICYKEDVGELEAQLRLAGLAPTELRGIYTPEEQQYSAVIRCFLNHRNAWQIAAETPGYTLICEADFVPCRSLGEFPVFWPLENPLAWGYLYQGSPRLLNLVGATVFLRGHCAPLVSYVINQLVAKIMLRFFEHEIREYGREKYFAFDAHLQWWVMGQGGEAYIPLRHYGEHGGLPNPEHAKSKMVRRGGLHRADNLAGPLAFLPQYAQGSWHAFRLERAKARVFGWGRLLTGRWIIDTDVYKRDLRRTIDMQWIGVRRLLP